MYHLWTNYYATLYSNTRFWHCIAQHVHVVCQRQLLYHIFTLYTRRLFASVKCKTPGRGRMYHHTYSKSMDQPGEVANPARGQLDREDQYFPVPVHA